MTCFRTGHISWNKGLTKKDKRVRRYCFNSGNFTRDQQLGNVNGFKKGFIPWNKGLKGIHLSLKTEFKKGRASPRKGKGLTPLERLFRNSEEYKKWRMKVFRRDNFTCIWCGHKSHMRVNGHSDIVADHIKSYALYPELRIDVSNGRTLCYWCHKKTKTYGFNKQFMAGLFVN